MWHKMKVVADLVGAGFGFYCIFWMAREWGRQEILDEILSDDTTSDNETKFDDITINDIVSGKVYLEPITKDVFRVVRTKNA